MGKRKTVRSAFILLCACCFIRTGTLEIFAETAVRDKAPLELRLDVNSRQTPIYDGYTSYVMGNRVSPGDTFTVEPTENGVNLDEATIHYYLLTFYGSTDKYLECTVHGVKEGEHYPAVRPETIAKENGEEVFDTLERTYMVELCLGEGVTRYYFNLLKEEDAAPYRNILLGKWEFGTGGWRYYYQEDYIKGWAQINERWFYFGGDGYMKTGWQEYKGNWYYLSTDDGHMESGCSIDGFWLDENGIRTGENPA